MKVAIIGPHPIIRLGIKAVIKTHVGNYTIIEVESTTRFMNEYASQDFDGIIVCVNSGFCLQKSGLADLIASHRFKGKCLIYLEDLQANIIHACMKAGVNNLLSAYEGLEELLTCIRQVLERKAHVSNVITDRISQSLMDESQNQHEPWHDLNTRELEVARYLLKGTRPSEIASILKTNPSTVSFYKKKIFKKLQVDNLISLTKLMPQDPGLFSDDF